MNAATKVSLVLAALFASLMPARTASAYCRLTTGCGKVSSAIGDNCFEPVDTCSSLPTAWAESCVGFSVEAHGSQRRGISFEDAVVITQDAFDQWLGPVCDGEKPGLSVQALGQSECATFEYNELGTWYGNVNSIFFADDGLPHCGKNSSSGDTIADTCSTRALDTGAIYDADIGVDSKDYSLRAPDSDLQSVLLHEVGHFLGLAHVDDPTDVMFPNYTGRTTLSDDDKRGICAIYPPHRAAEGTCDYLPRHGFSAVCSSDQPQLSCSLSPRSATSRSATSRSATSRGALSWAVVAAIVVGSRRRWRRRRR